MGNIRNTFAKNLKAHREKKGLSQEMFAEKLNINVRYIQQLEGKNTPNVKIDTVANLAKILKVSPADLLKN